MVVKKNRLSCVRSRARPDIIQIGFSAKRHFPHARESYLWWWVDASVNGLPTTINRRANNVILTEKECEKMRNETNNDNLRTPPKGVSIVVVEPPKPPEPKSIGSGGKRIRCRKCRHDLFWLDDYGASCDACGKWTDLESAIMAVV